MKICEVTMPGAGKAGLIPYCTINGELKLMFMISSDPRFGGTKPNIAKGRVDPGEAFGEAAFREASEELGLKRSNLKTSPRMVWSGQHEGMTEGYLLAVYAAEVRNPHDFGPHDRETKSVIWLSPEEYAKMGRSEQKPIVAAVVNKIR